MMHPTSPGREYAPLLGGIDRGGARSPLRLQQPQQSSNDDNAKHPTTTHPSSPWRTGGNASDQFEDISMDNPEDEYDDDDDDDMHHPLNHNNHNNRNTTAQQQQQNEEQSYMTESSFSNISQPYQYRSQQAQPSSRESAPYNPGQQNHHHPQPSHRYRATTTNRPNHHNNHRMSSAKSGEYADDDDYDDDDGGGAGKTDRRTWTKRMINVLSQQMVKNNNHSAAPRRREEFHQVVHDEENGHGDGGGGGLGRHSQSSRTSLSSVESAPFPTQPTPQHHHHDYHQHPSPDRRLQQQRRMQAAAMGIHSHNNNNNTTATTPNRNLNQNPGFVRFRPESSPNKSLSSARSASSSSQSLHYYEDTYNDQPWRWTFGTHEDDGIWMNTSDRAGTIMAATVWLLISYSILTMLLLTRQNHISQYWAAVYSTICTLALASHAKTTFTDPGAVASSAVPLVTKGVKFHAMCSICQSYKPKYAHHCRICNRCITRMDHHCPWMNNCVGAANLKHFTLFLLYTWLGSGMALTLFLVNYFFCSSSECEFTVLEMQLVRLMSVICFGAWCFTSSMLMSIIYGIITGVGTIDRLKKKATNTWHLSDEEPLLLADVVGSGPFWTWFLPIDPFFPDYDRVMGYATMQRLLREQSMGQQQQQRHQQQPRH